MLKIYCKGHALLCSEFFSYHESILEENYIGIQFFKNNFSFYIFSSCYEHRLESHLTSCNARIDESCPYRTTNINLGSVVPEPEKKKLSSISNEELLSLIAKINEVYDGKFKNFLKLQ